MLAQQVRWDMDADVVIIGYGGAGAVAAITAHDADAQVMRVDGNPIPRLYANGECGSIVGMSYTFGMNLSELIVFGRIAGENAAKYPPL